MPKIPPSPGFLAALKGTFGGFTPRPTIPQPLQRLSALISGGIESLPPGADIPFGGPGLGILKQGAKLPLLQRALTSQKSLTKQLPQMNKATRADDIIFMSFDDAARIPTTNEIKALARAKGINVGDVIKFKKGLTSGLAGETRFRLDVRRSGSKSGSESAKKLLQDLGLGEGLSAPTEARRAIKESGREQEFITEFFKRISGG